MAHIVTDKKDIFNVFQPGLIRGVERLPYAPNKRYFYVEHPTEGWRVYLRAACFIHQLYQPFSTDRFIVVKRTDGDPKKATWEPPKGQMEGKDAKPEGAPLIKLMAENIRREVLEEAKISKIHHLRYTGLVVQSREKDYPPNHYFQYHLFQAIVMSKDIQAAQEEFEWLRQHPVAFARLRADRREKDALAWFDPSKTHLMGRWSPSIVALYLQGAE